jgi:NhaP-type Na+/H+ or K+/H+ antiporter
MALYEVALVFVALAVFGAVVLPRLLADKPLSFPIIFVGAGYLLFSLPLGVTPPDPVAEPELAERLTELVVIIALMGAGLKLDRPFEWRAWMPTWRLLGITMPLTIAATAFLGWATLDLLVPTAVLLGAVVAPTDPVLASDVQVGPPTQGTDEHVDPDEQEGTIRFALTSESGLNDGLAFPFTNLAIVLAGVGVSVEVFDFGNPFLQSALIEWFAVDFVYRILAGVVLGYAVGKAVAYLVFGAPATTELARVMEGAEALAATLLSYGITELAHGYGFIAVFVTALVMRHYEWEHEYYEHLHEFAVLVERLLMAAVLVLFGGAVAGGLLDPLTVRTVLVGLAIVFVVRPFAGIVGLVGGSGSRNERVVIASFGIRGIGSFYYLAFALNEASFQELELLTAAPRLWALVGFVALTSMIVHGITVTPVMDALDRRRRRAETTDAEPQAQ